jgi:integral membrane sensor domain MASE1
MADNSREVTVTDIKIPFWSMVVLMVKWALAAVPAIIILIVIGSFLSMALHTLLGGAMGWYWGPPGRMM